MDDKYFGLLFWRGGPGEFYIVHEDILVFESDDSGLGGGGRGGGFVHVGQACLAHVQVSESMKHEHTQDDGDEAREGAHDVHGGHAVPLLEEDDGGGDHDGGEEHVVDGEHQGGIEDVQRPVEEVDLSAERKGEDEGQDVGEGVPHDWHPLEEVLDGDAQTLDGRHREGPDHRADDDVDEDVPLSVTWGDDEDEDEAEDQQQHSKHDVPFRGEGDRETPRPCFPHL